MALIRRVALTAAEGVALALELVLDAGDGTEFSFSSTSLVDDTDGSFCSFSKLEDVDDRSFEGSRIDADIRRCCMGALIVLGVERAAEPDGMRVGVAEAAPAMLRAEAGGGPIAPSIERFVVCVVVPFVRILLPKVGLVAVEGASLRRRSLVVLPVSDSTEGGLDATVGVPNMEDSRRCAGTFAVEAGVPPAVPRTPMRRFSYNTLSVHYQHQRTRMLTSSSSCCFESSAMFRPLMSSLSCERCFWSWTSLTSLSALSC